MSTSEHEAVVLHLTELGRRMAAATGLAPQLAARAAMEEYFTAPALSGSRVLPAPAPAASSEWILDERSDDGRRVLFLHGGGYIAGGPSSYRRFAMWIARATGCAVLLCNYRLAPEHPFPAAVHDAVGAFRWMREHGPQGRAPAQRAFVLGDSAGGGLALAALLSMLESGEGRADAAVTFSAWTDLTHSGASMTRNEDPGLGSLKSVAECFAHLYLQGADARHPLASPLFGCLAGLPPLLMQTSDAELFLDDSTRFVERARAAGVEAQIEVWPGLVHVWQGFVPQLPAAAEALRHAGDFIRAH